MGLVDSIGHFLDLGSAQMPTTPAETAADARWHAGLEVIGGAGEALGGAGLGLVSAATPAAPLGVPLGLMAIGDGSARVTHGLSNLWNGERTPSVIGTAAQIAGLGVDEGERVDAAVSTALSLPIAATGTGALLTSPSFLAKGLGLVTGAASADALLHSGSYAATGDFERPWLTQGIMDGFGVSDVAAGYAQAGASLIAPLAIGRLQPLATTTAATAFDATKTTTDRWTPDVADTRFSHQQPPVLGTTQHGLDTLNDVIAGYFDARPGLIEVVGPSAVGKGFVTESLKGMGRDVQVLEQDYFMAPPEVRAGLIEANVQRALSGRDPVEWRGFWNHSAAQGVLRDVRAALDSGVETDVLVPNAWHRKPNEQGLNYFDEVLTLKPDTLVIWDAKYPVNRTPGGGRFDDFSLKIIDDPANIRTRYQTRTEKTYQDRAVVDLKLEAYDKVLAPSYEHFLGIQDKAFATHPEGLPDLILNVDPLYVPPRD